MNCLIKLYQFFEMEKIVIKNISTQDFLVTDYCDLKLIIKNNLYFSSFNYKENSDKI